MLPHPSGGKAQSDTAVGNSNVQDKVATNDGLNINFH